MRCAYFNDEWNDSPALQEVQLCDSLYADVMRNPRTMREFEGDAFYDFSGQICLEEITLAEE